MYCGDYEGRMPYGRAFESGPKRWGWVHRTKAPYLTTPLDAPESQQLDAIREGQLYKYMPSVKAFRCPVAASHEKRTYSASVAANSIRPVANQDTSHILKNLNRVKNPANRLLFIDDYGQNWDAAWAIPRSQATWHNPIPMRHGFGTVLSFFDGHSSYWKWEDRQTQKWAALTWEEAESKRNTMSQPDNPDLSRIQKAVWGDSLTYKPK